MLLCATVFASYYKSQATQEEKQKYVELIRTSGAIGFIVEPRKFDSFLDTSFGNLLELVCVMIYIFCKCRHLVGLYVKSTRQALLACVNLSRIRPD